MYVCVTFINCENNTIVVFNSTYSHFLKNTKTPTETTMNSIFASFFFSAFELMFVHVTDTYLY